MKESRKMEIKCTKCHRIDAYCRCRKSVKKITTNKPPTPDCCPAKVGQHMTCGKPLRHTEYLCERHSLVQWYHDMKNKYGEIFSDAAEESMEKKKQHEEKIGKKITPYEWCARHFNFQTNKNSNSLTGGKQK